jgi:hypothetical protein
MFGPTGASYDRPVDDGVRYRCRACGNLTRFDVVSTRRTRAFHHYSIAGELRIEDEEVLEVQLERISCRWCGAAGDAIEALDASADGASARRDSDAEQLDDQAS